MTKIECTPECKERTKKAEAAIETWKAKWPNYCRKCEGAGDFCYSFDPSPSGVALSPGWLEDCEPCPNCTEKGICARCGANGLNPDTGEGPCQVCGWNYDDMLQSMPECFCWEIVDVEDQELIGPYYFEF